MENAAGAFWMSQASSACKYPFCSVVLRKITCAQDFPVAFQPCFLYNKSRCIEMILQRMDLDAWEEAGIEKSCFDFTCSLSTI